MRTAERLLVGATVAILAAGVAGSFTVGSSGAPRDSLVGPASIPTTTTAPTSTASAPDTPGPSTAALTAGMLAPIDLGGFYRVDQAYASTVLTTAPCLAGMAPSQSQSGRAYVGLMVPAGHPAVTEVAASYPGSTAEQVYQSVKAVLAACSGFAVDLDGAGVRVQISHQDIQAVGDASAAYGGTFPVGGRTESLQVAVVLDGKIVLVVVYVDTVPASNAIYGDLPSTVEAAIGKLA